MSRVIGFMVLLANLLVLKCQEEPIEDNAEHSLTTGNPSYSFSYGVSDVHTGDVKTVWEEKNGDTVKGHYSVLEPNGSKRTVEYSSHPKTGFTAIVNNDGEKVEHQREERSFIENKAMRDYGKLYDFSEDAEIDSYMNERKRAKNPFDTFKDYSLKKRPKYPLDLEASEFSHSITIKHPRDETGAESESHTHFGLDTDPNCKTKNKNPNLYTNVVEFDPRKPHEIKHPLFTPELLKDNFEKYEPSNIDYEKYISPYGSKLPKIDPIEYEKLLSPYGKGPKLEDYNFRPSFSKYKYPFIPDVPSPESYYGDDIPPRPRKKKPHKKPEFHYPSEDLEEYWIPKKKKKNPPRVIEPLDYLPDPIDEFDRPRYPSEFEDDEDDRPYRGPLRGASSEKVVKKVVKKRKPVFNILDILDI